MSSSSRRVEFVLQPGKFFFGDEPVRVSTLLGSCVAITMWHPLARIGGICHFMLPYAHGHAAGGQEGKYADDALRLFLGRIEAHGTRPPDYQVRLFGGGRQICGLAADEARSVGRQNIDAGRRLLGDNGFSICGEDLAASGYRKLTFDLASGETRVRRGAQSLCTPDACAMKATPESVCARLCKGGS
ncbi:MAG: hypothetical protein A2045_10720 [Rhodocyclales bacterium GWA2_65_20]|nr:MAG: hypothetical protein A2045_10720 [Rhodocyclales bacterium GWA2_65_20]